MYQFNLWVNRIAYSLNIVGGISLLFIMLVVIADILTRTLFGMTKGEVDLTFPGSFEMVKYGLLFALAYCMPYGLNRGQVVVDLFTDNWSVKSKTRIAAFYMLFFAAFGFLMAENLIHSGSLAKQSGETTQDLMIPMFYIYYLAAVGMAVLGLRAVSISLILWFDRDGELA
ncbi:TRAP transporter small permease [Reinekea blandensis]|uniref:TRAP transporter small permease protein n=1 Tax=Reinekea blandensis MED297 TaxID=314283 RepID=A4BGX1_9GAMM|nr:TRAP transporter small permease subunit [Reinekea blandensis]EAR08617.1 TRAP-T family transporter, small inner membrane subunit [Reinekea sp. MED297] [Reinekea blandensis MED297]